MTWQNPHLLNCHWFIQVSLGTLLTNRFLDCLSLYVINIFLRRTSQNKRRRNCFLRRKFCLNIIIIFAPRIVFGFSNYFLVKFCGILSLLSLSTGSLHIFIHLNSFLFNYRGNLVLQETSTVNIASYRDNRVSIRSLSIVFLITRWRFSLLFWSLIATFLRTDGSFPIRLHILSPALLMDLFDLPLLKCWISANIISLWDYILLCEWFCSQPVRVTSIYFGIV